MSNIDKRVDRFHAVAAGIKNAVFAPDSFMATLKADMAEGKASFMRPDYDDNGCIERSALVQELLESAGQKHGLVSIDADESRGWHIHMAGFSRHGDEIVIYDPMYFDTPVSLQDWEAYWKDGRSAIGKPIVIDGFLNRPSINKTLQSLYSHDEGKSSSVFGSQPDRPSLSDMVRRGPRDPCG